jgi:hypothetical protein
LKNKHSQEYYKLLEHAYAGAGGFADGDYLLQYPRESDEKYKARKKMAYYFNYFKPCVDAHVDPIFERTPAREWSGAAEDVWKMFMENTDIAGTDLDNLMKSVAQVSKIYGTAFIVMDSAKEQLAKSEITLLDLADKRENIPYAFVVSPDRVIEIKADKFRRINYFAYTEDDLADENKKNTRVMKPTGWELREGYGVGVELGRVIEQGAWTLGCVPVIPVPSRIGKAGAFFPLSEFFPVAQTNKHIFNACSWLTEILAGQTFPIITYPSASPESFNIGVNNALSFNPESKHAPSFIAPPNGPAETLTKDIENSRQECYRMAGVVNVTGVKSTESGEAKAWDFKRTNQLLSNFSGILQSAENRLVQLFRLFTGMKFAYTVKYPTDFAYTDLSAELANAIIAKDLNFGDEFNIEIFKRVLTAYLSELSADDFDALVKSYKGALADQKLDSEQNPPVGE